MTSASENRTAEEKLYARMPWHLVDLWWDLGEEKPFQSYSIDVTISEDVPSKTNLYIAPIGIAHLSKIPFYGGIQTQVDGHTKSDPRIRKIGPGFRCGHLQTKVETGPQSADVLPLEESRRLITQKTKEALSKRNEIRPIKIDYPATLRWDYLPKGSLRTHNPEFKPVDNPRQVEKTGDSVETLLIEK